MRDAVEDINPFESFSAPLHNPSLISRASTPYTGVRVPTSESLDPQFFTSQPSISLNTEHSPFRSEPGPSHVDLPAIHGPALCNDRPDQTYDNWNGLLAHNRPRVDSSLDLPRPVDETCLHEVLAHPMSAEEIAAVEAEGPPRFENVELASMGAHSLVGAHNHYCLN